MKEYRVRYAYHSAYGSRIVHGIIYKNLDEVCAAIRKIDRIGYELVGVDSRQVGYTSPYDGWNEGEKNF